jgi:phenylacetate-coenzyme A ligase PaaK-like adenylate-forming protein
VQRLQERRLRQQVQLAARDTAYYADLFARCGLNVQEFTAAQLTELPLTRKEAIRNRPEAFVRRGFQPTLCTMTTGTTGQGTTTLFTMRETRLFSLLSALALRGGGLISTEDVVQVSTSARALLGNQTAMDAYRHVGALIYQTGVVEPAQALALLAKRHSLPGRKERVSVFFTYPSYLGKLIETGLALGYGPQDFGLELLIVGGEVSSPGLRQRSEALFGPVKFDEGYGISEVWPFGGAYCEQGHLHFDPLRGLMEVIDPDTGQPARPGEAGSLVLTPFLPYRESSIILRYDTGDMVRTLAEPCTCSLSHRPATGPLLGKQRFCVRSEGGWVGPRDILEVLEPNRAIPLPVRCGLWATAGGLGVEVAVGEASDRLQQELTEQLRSAGLPVTTVKLVTDPAQLERPLPWRGDLHEHSFLVSQRG